ncbi:MAG: hypothetical protein ACFFKA_12320, partial [Candidatus Thorarchaeota archaeon]
MERKNLTWFGFNITQKQSVQIFILSLVGIIFSIFILLSLTIPYMVIFTYSDPYYNYSFVFQLLLTMSPYYILLITILA